MTHKQMDKKRDRQTDGQTGKNKIQTDRQTDFFFADNKNENRNIILILGFPRGP